MAKTILAADIGGTNSRFAQFKSDGQSLMLQSEKWLPTTGASSFAELLEQLRSTDFPLKPEDADAVGIAVAGPIEHGTFSAPPNIAWTINLSKGTVEFGFKRFGLINDFTAQAYACHSKIGREAEIALSGTSERGSAIAVIGAGTGLGKALIIPVPGGGILVNRSEGGHANLCVESEEEFRFQEFVQKKLGVAYVEWEDAVSGRGLSYIHEFLTGSELKPAEVAKTFQPNSPTLQWAARIFARACRNFVLETMALGGLYIAGGVAAKNPILLKHPVFAQTFRGARTHADLLKSVPVWLISNQDSGLWGAAQYAELNLLGDVQNEE